ncbi:MAG: LamG-like jellyroll fold domain-containing protein, partial [Prevotella sp.]
NEVVEKQVEVYAGAEYDYEDLGISLFDEEDYAHVYSVNLSAHYVPAAGAINISKPGDKWVVNTESAYDDEQMAYYLPVHIDGFDVNFRNFDHIELQYKLSNQGDKDWVNICSYYRNNEEGQALMALASGEKQLMEHDGYIDAFFYGETDPIEQYYDIRAVTFCRHGNGYLTRSSNILTGIKDTRRPQLFGTPQPVDGILGIGDDIIMRFSEPIAGNYLSAVNNFQVSGQTNSSNISLSSSLRFNGKDVALTQAPRNLEGRSFTIDVMLNPEPDGKAMTILSHGRDTHALELGLTADRRLTAAIKYNDTIPAAVFTADEPCTFDGLREVFFLFDTDIDEGITRIAFYDGNTQVGAGTYNGIYRGTGRTVLGRSVYGLLEGYESYTGDMLEYRLWNHALSDEEMNSYRQKQLTGYELGLLDNYPLNEGKGEFSYNRTTGGSDLRLVGTSWKMPDGLGMKLDGEKGFRLDNRLFNRYDYQDYTMMFWFRTKDASGTLFGNGTATTEPGAKSHFNFAVEDSALVVNLSGLRLKTNARTSDGHWHHVALSVNRSRNVGCLYFDNSLAKTFAVDTLGGISGNLLAAGATYLDANTAENAITGNIDEIAMYEMAMTARGIKNCSAYTPSGGEKGMLAYLNFSKNERQLSNEIKLVPTGVSLRRYKDTTTGEYTWQRDTIVDQTDVMRLYDAADYAPMHDTQTLENIRFSYVADGKDLLVNLDVPDVNIEKTNVYVVVNDVTDMQGNVMASPVVLDLYVYRNPLRWTDKRIRLEAAYGEGLTFEATVKNLSGKTRNFTLQGLPLWMTASTTSGSVGALDEETLTFTISPYTNIGDYEEVVWLVGEDDMTEPLPITLKVRGTAPEWTVDEDLLHTNITMNLIGQVTVRGEVANDADDMLAVFNEEHRLLGVTHLAADDNSGANDGLAYLNIYNNNYAETELHFEFFDASTGYIHSVVPDRTIKFKHDTVVGTTTNPVMFTSDKGVVQAIPLQKGWNWVSFNVAPPTTTVKSMLNSATKWETGDALEAERADGSYSLLSYKASPNPYDPNTPVYSWDCADSLISINVSKMYRFYSNSNKIGYIYGIATSTPITVKKGWNRIGFISGINLPVGTAMAQYTEMASEGDIIKSQSEFAILSVDALGNKQWKGTLEYLRVGEGYMLKRNQDSEVSFYYPIYLPGWRYSGSSALSKAPAFENTSGTSMTVVAVADGVETVQGDRLTVYRGAEVCGIAEADEQGLFFLTVGADGADEAYEAHGAYKAHKAYGAYGAGATDHLTFTIERSGELIAATQSQMSYVPDAALGTPDEPTAISFLPADYTGGDGWYSISGVRLSKRPTQQGIYIHRNEKVVIK